MSTIRFHNELAELILTSEEYFPLFMSKCAFDYEVKTGGDLNDPEETECSNLLPLLISRSSPSSDSLLEWMRVVHFTDEIGYSLISEFGRSIVCSPRSSVEKDKLLNEFLNITRKHFLSEGFFEKTVLNVLMEKMIDVENVKEKAPSILHFLTLLKPYFNNETKWLNSIFTSGKSSLPGSLPLFKQLLEIQDADSLRLQLDSDLKENFDDKSDLLTLALSEAGFAYGNSSKRSTGMFSDWSQVASKVLQCGLPFPSHLVDAASSYYRGNAKVEYKDLEVGFEMPEVKSLLETLILEESAENKGVSSQRHRI